MPIIPEPPEIPHTNRPPLPIRPTAGTSPMVDRISSDTVEIRVTPAFDNHLHLAFMGNHEMPEASVGSVLAVTIYGDGRIEWHADPEGGAAA